MWLRRNNGENISANIEKFLVEKGIRSETSNPYKSWQNGTAERIQTILSISRTVMNASGLIGRFWFHATMYSSHIHNIQYSNSLHTSPHVLMFDEKPSVVQYQMFGVEAWLYRRAE